MLAARCPPALPRQQIVSFPFFISLKGPHYSLPMRRINREIGSSNMTEIASSLARGFRLLIPIDATD